MSTLTNNLLAQYRNKIEEQERHTLHPKASFSRDHSRYLGPEDDHRLPYKRDVDRIIHSKAFARYSDKTQVVYLVPNEHVTNRGLHVQLVSSFARGIAEILGLNLDLVEAIALGHDVGHPPFGHEGEGYLSELCQEHGLGIFAHPWQSCRLFTEIEPLNLGLAVYDGFLCHDGGLRTTQYRPNFGKTWENHFSELIKKIEDPNLNIWPGTLEGCLVKMCDTMSYIGRDIEDAISIGLIDRNEIPKTALGNANRDILGYLASDVITQSYGQDHIAMSQETYDALKTLWKFNLERFYLHPKLKVESQRIKDGYRILFEYLLKDLTKNHRQSYLWKVFAHNKSQKYQEETPPLRMVVDFIAGMTDGYFVRTIENLVVPGRIAL